MEPMSCVNCGSYTFALIRKRGSLVVTVECQQCDIEVGVLTVTPDTIEGGVK